MPTTVRAFALSCGLEALLIALPYALGDRIAVLAFLLRPLCIAGFGTSILAWTLVASIVLPAAIISGAQFPLVIGLYGARTGTLGREVGRAYLANTIGAIAGALAGGFGLMPALTAPGCWRLVAYLLAAASIIALVAARASRGYGKSAAIAVVAALAVFFCFQLSRASCICA